MELWGIVHRGVELEFVLGRCMAWLSTAAEEGSSGGGQNGIKSESRDRNHDV